MKLSFSKMSQLGPSRIVEAKVKLGPQIERNGAPSLERLSILSIVSGVLVAADVTSKTIVASWTLAWPHSAGLRFSQPQDIPKTSVQDSANTNHHTTIANSIRLDEGLMS